MAFLDVSQYKSAFKKLFGKGHTANAKDLVNEAKSSFVQLAATQVFGQTIPSTPSQAVSEGKAESVAFTLVLDGTSNGLSYQANYPIGHPKVGQAASNIISPVYGDGYRAILKNNGTEVPPLAANNWFLDYANGVVTSETALSLTNGTLEAYVYIGKTVQDQLDDKLTVKDDGSLIDANAYEMNFTGAGVAVTQTESGKVQVSVTGQPLTIKDEGSTIDSNATILDFTGVGVSASGVSPGTVEIQVTGQPIVVKDEGSTVDSNTTEFNFVGAGVTTTQTLAGKVQVSVPGASNLTIKDEGITIDTAVSEIDIAGAGLIASGYDTGKIRIMSDAQPLEIRDEGNPIDTGVKRINFAGSGVQATQTAPGIVNIIVSTGTDSQHTQISVTNANGEYDFVFVDEGMFDMTNYQVSLTASGGINAKRVIPVVSDRLSTSFKITLYDIITLNGGTPYDASASSVSYDVVLAGGSPSNIHQSITINSVGGYYDFVFADEGYNNMTNYHASVTLSGGVTGHIVPVLQNKLSTGFRVQLYNVSALNGGVPYDASVESAIVDLIVFGTFL